jgi:hypothetical protein
MRVAAFLIFSMLSALASANGLKPADSATTGRPVDQAVAATVGAMNGGAPQCGQPIVIENPETAKAIGESAESDAESFAVRLAELPAAAQASVATLAGAHALGQPLVGRAYFAKLCERLAQKGIAPAELTPALQTIAQALGVAYADTALGGSTETPAGVEAERAAAEAPAATAPGAGLQSPGPAAEAPQARAENKMPDDAAAQSAAPLAPEAPPASAAAPTPPPAETESAAPVPVPADTAPANTAPAEAPAGEPAPPVQTAETPTPSPTEAAPVPGGPSAPTVTPQAEAPELTAPAPVTAAPSAPEAPAASAAPPAQVAEAPAAPEPTPPAAAPSVPEAPAASAAPPAEVAEAPAAPPAEVPSAPEAPAASAEPPAKVAEAPAAPESTPQAVAPSAPEAPGTSASPPAQVAETPAAPEPAPAPPAAPETPGASASPPAQVAEAPAAPEPAPPPATAPSAAEAPAASEQGADGAGGAPPRTARALRPAGAVDKLGEEECRTLGVLDTCPDLNAVLDRLLERPLEYNHPSTMLLGRKTEITLVLRTDWEGKDLPAEVSEELKGLPGEVKQGLSKITRVMSAELTGREFDITPSARQERTVVPPQPVSWTWQVSPTDTGEKKPLKLRLYAHLQDGSNTMPPILVKTLDASINVDVTTWDWIVNQARTLEPIYAIGAALLGLLTAILTYFLTRSRREPAYQGGYRDLGGTGPRDSGPVIGDLGQSATDRRTGKPGPAPAKADPPAPSGSGQTGPRGAPTDDDHSD